MQNDQASTVSAEQLAAFFQECRDIVGANWVKSEAGEVAPYGWVAIPFETNTHLPAGAVCPANAEETRAVILAAGRHAVSVWPTSTGRNIGYGSSSVADPGTIVLDLRRMDRISDFDPQLGTVVVEPGVTYHQLQEFIAANGGGFWIDFPGPGPIVSPLGNTLERGHGVTPYGDHFAHSCGYEVLLADGTFLRTGLGGVEGTNGWQSYRHGYGPSLDGIFTQSNFGVVTKMGLWLMPEPETHRTLMASWAEYDDIVRLTDCIRDLRLDGTIRTEGVLGNAGIVLASIFERSEKWGRPEALSQDFAISEVRQFGLGAWNYVFTLYGREDQVESDYQEARRRLEAAGATVGDGRDEQAINILTLKSFALFNWAGGGGLAWFSPISPMRGRDMKRQFDLVRSIMDRHGIDFLTGVAMGERAALNVMPLTFDRSDPEWMSRARDCYGELVQQVTGAGYGIYRTSLGWMDEVAQRHGTANMDVNRRIKRALDPGGIIAPGKSGIRV